MNGKQCNDLLRETFGFLTPLQEARFAKMDAIYREWNSKINVISRKDIDNLYEHHVLHSLAIARYLQLRRPDLLARLQEGGPRVLDLGTGGGFPGIPLAVLFPETAFTLCDSVGKKALVARAAADALGLENVEVVNARAESLGRAFEVVVSRAVASLTDFYPWVRKQFTERILYLRGGDVAEETALLMGRERLAAGSVSTWPVDAWLQDAYFAGKYVIDIAK